MLREPTEEMNYLTLVKDTEGRSFFVEEADVAEDKPEVILYNPGDIVRVSGSPYKYKLIRPSVYSQAHVKTPSWVAQKLGTGAYEVSTFTEENFEKVEELEFEVGDLMTSVEDDNVTVWQIKTLFPNGETVCLKEYNGETHKDDWANNLTKISQPKFSVDDLVKINEVDPFYLLDVSYWITSDPQWIEGTWQYGIELDESITLLAKEACLSG